MQAEFACGTEYDGLCGTVVGVDLLQHGQAKGGCLACAGLGKGYDIVAYAKEVGYYFFLYGHGVLVAHFADGAAYLGRNA